jgi:hypothetical protein
MNNYNSKNIVEISPLTPLLWGELRVPPLPRSSFFGNNLMKKIVEYYKK